MGGNMVDGRWRIDYRDSQGKRHRETFDTRKEADEALDAIKARIKRGEFVAAKLIPKFKEIAEDWFASKADRRPGTVGNWRAQIDRHLNPTLGELRLDRVDVALIEKLRDELRANLSARSVNAVLTTAAAIFKLAVRRKLANGNPAAEAEGAFMGAVEIKDETTKQSREEGVQPVRPEEVLNPDEIRKLLEKAEPGFYRTLIPDRLSDRNAKRGVVRASMVRHRAQGNRFRDRRGVATRQNLRPPIAIVGAGEEGRCSRTSAFLPAQDKRGNTNASGSGRARGRAAPLEAAISAERA